MTDRRFTNPRTGEVVDDPSIRPFAEFLRELGEGTTQHELSEVQADVPVHVNHGRS